jgi:hypothetical protein
MATDRDYVIHGAYAELLVPPPWRFNWLGWAVIIGAFLWGYTP